MIVKHHIAVFLAFTIVFIISALSAEPQGQNPCAQKTEDNHCCMFPFIYKGKRYHSCTKDDSSWFFGFGSEYYWCYYNKDEKYDKCQKPIYYPSTMSTRKTVKTQISTILTASTDNILVKITTSSLPSSDVTRSSYIYDDVTSPKSSLVKIVFTSSIRSKKSTINSDNKTKFVIYIVCAVVAGLALFVGITIAIYFIRKRKVSSINQEEKKSNEKVKDETKNPLYEEAQEDSERETEFGGRSSREITDPTYEEVYLSKEDREINNETSFIHINEIYSSS